MNQSKHSGTTQISKFQLHAVSIKTVILDTGDGAFTDASVKVRPHHSNPAKVVLKCTDAKRLAVAAAKMGLTPCGPMIRGHKHFILVCWKAQVGMALSGSPMASALAAGSGKLLKGK